MTEKAVNTLKLKPHHGGISVPDIEASIIWYRDMLGFTVMRRQNIDAIQAKVAFMKNGNFHIEL